MSLDKVKKGYILSLGVFGLCGLVLASMGYDLIVGGNRVVVYAVVAIMLLSLVSLMIFIFLHNCPACGHVLHRGSFFASHCPECDERL